MTNEIVRLTGRLDAITSPPIEEGLIAKVRNGTTVLLMDFSAVHYISSAGMRVLLTLNKILKEKGGKLVLFQVPPEVMIILKMAGFDQILRFASSEAEALS